MTVMQLASTGSESRQQAAGCETDKRFNVSTLPILLSDVGRFSDSELICQNDSKQQWSSVSSTHRR